MSSDGFDAPSASDPASVEGHEPVDPAVLVAEEMLKRALAAVPNLEGDVRLRGSVTVVQTVSAGWNEVMLEVWMALIQDGQEPASGRREMWDPLSSWLAILHRDEQHFSVRGTKDRDGALVADATLRSMSVAGFSHDPEKLLPPDLLSAADHRIPVGAPIPEDVEFAARQLTGSEAAKSLDARIASRVTPRLLRLACRPGQDGDAYLARLHRLLEREETASSRPPPPVPRDAPTLDRLHGMDEAVTWGRSLAASLKEYAAGRLPWADVDGGCLLSGPPGCGKTLFARALATTCKVKLVSGSYARWLGTGSAHQGNLLKAMRATFDEARATAPAILFLDEVDSFPNRTTVTHYPEWYRELVNALLAEIDGVDGREGVVVVAACNQPELLDPALVRSGRLDRHIRIQLPTPDALARILREHLGQDLASMDLAWAGLAATGASGADCEAIVRGARRRAREADRAILPDDLLTEIGGEDVRVDADFRRAAVHEAGHALAQCELNPDELLAVTLRAAGASGGGIMSARKRAPMLAGDVRGRLVVFLAGRAAEKVVLGAPSSGAGGGPDSDLGQATLLAAMSVASFGLDEQGGLLWSGLPAPTTLPGMLAINPALATRVRAMLDDAYRDALELVRHRRAALDAVVDALLDRRALNGAEVAALVTGHPPPSRSCSLHGEIPA